MAEDGLGLRGLATVFQQQQGNVYAMTALAQRQRQNDREFSRLQQKQDLEWFSNESKLGFPKVRTELQKGLVDMMKDTYSGMTAISKDGMTRGGMTPEHRDAILNLKNNFDSFKALAESFDGDISEISNIIAQDKEKVFDQQAFSGKLKSILSQSFERDGQGKIVGINPLALDSLRNIREDESIYSDTAKAHQFVDSLGSIAAESMKENATSFTSRRSEFTNGLYKTKPDGSPELDINTGKPIPIASPEAIRLWDSDDIRRQKLDKYAQSITKDGERWEGNRAKAYKQFVVDKFGTYKEDKATVNDKSAFTLGQAQKQADADSRYKTLRSVLDNYDESALAQTLNVNDRIKAEFNRQLPTEKVPDQIVVYKRETMFPDPLDPTAVKYSEWQPVEYIPIRNEQQKDVALFKLNGLMDEAEERSGFVVGQDAIRKIHNKNKAATKKKSTADQYNLN